MVFSIDNQLQKARGVTATDIKRDNYSIKEDSEEKMDNRWIMQLMYIVGRKKQNQVEYTWTNRQIIQKYKAAKQHWLNSELKEFEDQLEDPPSMHKTIQAIENRIYSQFISTLDG